jgi:hydroxymethylpyrimidine/phosphomethylpyrimidine kinase
MVATAGDRLLAEDALAALREELMPLADLATPNLTEAAILADAPLAADEAAMIAQGQAIRRFGARAVLVKGGHGAGPMSVDILVSDAPPQRFAAPRLVVTNDHGTGCTLAAAITAEIAKGAALEDAVASAKRYLHAALAAGADLGVGSGRGPVHHFHAWWPAARPAAQPDRRPA